MRRPALPLILLLASTAAMASDSGTFNLNQFTPPPGDTSVEYLRILFGEIVDMISSGSQSADASPGNDVVSQMMSLFCTGVLFLGMIFTGYMTIKSTIDTAHDGVILGKKMSEVWVPIRTAGGMALLLPAVGGYSLIQVFVLWISIQGVGLADAEWTTGITQVQKGGMVGQPILPDARPLAANIAQFQTCAAAMNKQYAADGSNRRIQPVSFTRTMANTGDQGNLTPLDLLPPVAIANSVQNYKNSRYTVVDYRWRALNADGTPAYVNPDVCGGISWKESWESSEGNANTKIIKAPLMAAHAAAVQAMISELAPLADTIVAGQRPTPGAIERAAEHYAKRMQAAAKQAVMATNDGARADFLKTADHAGWIFAGTWYNHLVKMSDAMQSTLNALPTSSPITIDGGAETAIALQSFQDAMGVLKAYASNPTDAVKQVYYQESDARTPMKGEGIWEYLRKMISAPFMGAINQMTQEIAGSNLNHMSQMKSFGDTLITAGEGFMAAIAGAAGVANSKAVGLTAGWGFDTGSALNVVSGPLTALILALFAFGAMLSTYAPMIPFIIWISAVANWFAIVIEAVVSAPLWAAAHIHPDGDDAVGRGGAGYMMILSVFMRPTLMLFGLIFAMLLTEPLANFVNTAFMSAVSGVQADSMTGIVSFLAYVAIYVIIMTTVIHAAFSLIHWVPDNAMRWIGGHISGGPASPDQQEGKANHIFLAAVNRARDATHGGLKGEKEGQPHAPSVGHGGGASGSDQSDFFGKTH